MLSQMYEYGRRDSAADGEYVWLRRGNWNPSGNACSPVSLV